MFDITKGLGIIAVISYHIDSDVLSRLSSQAILSFFLQVLSMLLSDGMMAVFFIISGYGFRPRPFKKAAVQQAKLLLIPYLWVSAAVILLNGLIPLLQGLGWMKAIKSAGKYAIGMMLGLRSPCTFFGIEFPWNGPAWFLLSLFISWCILTLLFSKCRPIVTGVLAALCGYVSLTLMDFKPGHLFCLFPGIGYVSMLYIGYLLKKRKWLDALQGKAGWLFCAGVVGLAAIKVLLTNYGVEFGAADVYRLVAPILTFVTQALAGMCLLVITRKLSVFRNRVTDAISFIGQNSIVYFCVNAVEFQIFPWSLYTQVFGDRPLLGFCVRFVISMTCATVVCLLVRNRYSIMERLKHTFSRNE